jgi:hypothetical protein
MTDSSRDAQAEIRNATAKSETAYAAKRGIMVTNLTGDMFDATTVSACPGRVLRARKDDK